MKSIFKRILSDCIQYKFPLLLVGLYLVGTQLLFHASCPSVILLGLPCPACGLTRAGVFMLHGEFVAAASCNPTIFLWAAFLIYCFVFRYLLNRRPPHCLLLAALIGLCTLVWFTISVANGQLIPVDYPGLLKRLVPLAK